MKKFFLVSLLALLSSSLIGCEQSPEMNYVTFGSYENAASYESGDKEFKLSSSIKRLSINWLNGNVDIVKNDEATSIKVSEKCDKELEDTFVVKTYRNGDTLSVQYMAGGSYFTEPFEKDLTIVVPSSLDLDYIYCATKSANIKCDVNGDECSFHSESGDIDVKKSKDARYLYTKTSYGYTKLDAQYVGMAYMYTSIGSYDVKINSFYLLDINTETGTANITINDKTASFIIDTEFMENPNVNIFIPRISLDNGNYLVGDSETKNLMMANVINGTLNIY